MCQVTGILRSLVQIRLGGWTVLRHLQWSMANSGPKRNYLKTLSEVGFEPTPTYVDQNAPSVSKEETVLLSLAP